MVEIVSQLWNGGLKEDEIESLRGSINSFMIIDHTIYYPQTNQTSNLHQLKHGARVFSDFGPFNDCNAFIFELMNGEFEEMIKRNECDN